MRWPFVWRKTYEQVMALRETERVEFRRRHDAEIEQVERDAREIVRRAQDVRLEPWSGATRRWSLRINIQESFMYGLLNGPMEQDFWRYTAHMFAHELERTLCTMDFAKLRRDCIVCQESGE